MKKILFTLLACALFSAVSVSAQEMTELLNGVNLDGWKAAENPDAFTVVDGALRVNGTRGHLFYVGSVNNHCWKNFHVQAVVMTKAQSNSGIYIHTKFQETGWPTTGYECQIANTHPDPQKTASVYNVSKVNPAPANDDEWFTYDIYVIDKRIITKINGKVCSDWTEPDDIVPPEGWENRKLGAGTFAIQAHDPNSVVFIKSFKVEALD